MRTHADCAWSRPSRSRSWSCSSRSLLGSSAPVGAGQAVAALATAASGAAMAVGHLLSTTTFDVLVWVTVVLLVARILGGGDERQWLLVGLVVGLGLENKNLVLLLRRRPGLRVPPRPPLRPGAQPVALGGAALAILLWVPNLLWQARHGWPQLELADKIGKRIRSATGWARAAAAAADRAAPRAPLARRALVAPAAHRGATVSPARARLPHPARGRASSRRRSRTTRWACCWRCSAPGRRRRAMARGRQDDGGSTLGARDRRLRRCRGAQSRSRSCRRAICTQRRSPRSTRTRSRRSAGPPSTATVASVWNRLPPAERADAVVFTGNYGEAGAIARYGPALGLPRAYSGHNAFWRFGRPPDGARPIIVVGYHSLTPSMAASAAAGSRPGSTTASRSTTKSRALPCGCVRPPSSPG